MRLFYIIIIVLLGLNFGLDAKAFSISPSKILLTINSNSSQTVSVKIKNTENKDLYFIGKVLGVKQENNGSPVFLNNYTLAETWVVPQNKILIKKGAVGDFIFTINAPKDIPSGSYFLGLAIEPVLETKGVGLAGQIVSILNLQISGNARENLEISQWQFDKKKSNRQNFIFNLNLINKSNVEVDLGGEVFIYNWRNKMIGGGSEYLGNIILPNTVRFLTPQIKKNKFDFSPYYKAKINIKYGRLGLQTSADELIINWKIIGLLFGTLILVVVCLFLVRHALKIRYFRRF